MSELDVKRIILDLKSKLDGHDARMEEAVALFQSSWNWEGEIDYDDEAYCEALRDLEVQEAWTIWKDEVLDNIDGSEDDNSKIPVEIIKFVSDYGDKNSGYGGLAADDMYCWTDGLEAELTRN